MRLSTYLPVCWVVQLQVQVRDRSQRLRDRGDQKAPQIQEGTVGEVGRKPGEPLSIRAKETEFKKESVIRGGKEVRTEDVPQTWQWGFHVGSVATPHSATRPPYRGQPGMEKQECPLTSRLLQTEKQGVDGAPGWGLTGGGLGGRKVDQYIGGPIAGK